MIDFDKLTQPVLARVPIVGGTFQHNRKRYNMHNENLDGWYVVQLEGNTASIIEPIMVDITMFTKHTTVRGFVYNNNMVFQNFDVVKRKTGVEVMAPLALNNAETFSAVEAVYWEDKRFYFVGIDYTNVFIYEVKNCFENNESAGSVKGLTPELKTLWLFRSIEQQKLMEELAKAREAVQHEEFLKTVPGRLQTTLQNVGATLMNYKLKGKRIEIDWRLDSTGRAFNSIIDSDTFRVLEAGYCMSGDDNRHSLSSMVVLADDYEKRRVVHITRINDIEEGNEYE